MRLLVQFTDWLLLCSAKRPNIRGHALCKTFSQPVRCASTMTLYHILIAPADFYLIDPPPGALHKPVSPSKIVFAGDSAGAGLCLSVLTVLRDMGVTQPAGAVLISPWVDLTHSFPSVMQNTATVGLPHHSESAPR